MDANVFLFVCLLASILVGRLYWLFIHQPSLPFNNRTQSCLTYGVPELPEPGLTLINCEVSVCFSPSLSLSFFLLHFSECFAGARLLFQFNRHSARYSFYKQKKSIHKLRQLGERESERSNE